MSFFFALSFAISHCGTFMAFFLSPMIETASPYGYQSSVWASTVLTVASLMCTLPLLGKLKHITPLLHPGEEEEEEEEEEEDDEKDVEDGERVFDVDEPHLATIMSGEEEEESKVEVEEEKEEEEGGRSCLQGCYLYFQDLLTPAFLLLLLSILCYYLAFIPFENFAVDFLTIVRT